MRRTTVIAALVFLGGVTRSLAALAADSEFTLPAKTSPPFTYCIWYRHDPGNEAFLKDLAASPPDLFHVGYHIPFKAALGPTYGHELFTNDILAPQEIPREVERIQNNIRKMRGAGVDRMIAYVYAMAFFGNPAQRTGFFHFYDRWDDYRAFGLGPKPATDPSLWIQEGGPQPLGGGPPGVLHYEPCINHPAWLEYLDLVVRELAKVGYDGMFFDVNNLSCFCPHCQEKFDTHLLNKYGHAGLREAFGTDDPHRLDLSTIDRDLEDYLLGGFKEYLLDVWEVEHLAQVLGIEDPNSTKLEEDWRLLRCYMQGSAAEFPPLERFEEFLSERFGNRKVGEVSAEKREAFIQTVLRRFFLEYLNSSGLALALESRFGSADIRRRCRSKPEDLLLWVETQQFWSDSMASLFARLKRVGRTILTEQGRGGDFFTVANLGTMATVDGLNKRRVDAIDLNRWAKTADMQMFEEMHQPGSLESGAILSNIFAFRWAMGAGTRAGTLLYEVTDDRSADLAYAESAAGGGGAFIQPAISAPESRKRWKRFFEEHAGLWEGGTSWARVGLLFWSDQVYYENIDHLTMAHRLVNILSETQVPFDMVPEDGLQILNRYDIVIAPLTCSPKTVPV